MKAKARRKKARKAISLDLDAAIVPGESAAGLQIGMPIADVIAAIEPRKTTPLFAGTSYTYDVVKLWADDGKVTQIGVTAGYRGTLGAVAVGSSEAALKKLGKLGRDDDRNWVVSGVTGVVFDIKAKAIAGIYICRHDIHAEDA